MAADGIEQTFSELRAGAKNLQQYLEAYKWKQASVMMKKQLTLMIDCGIVYGVFGAGPGVSRDMSRALTKSAHEIFIVTIRGAAELSLNRHQYNNAICYAEMVLSVLNVISRSDLLVLDQPTTPANSSFIAVPPVDPLLPSTGTVTLRRETRCSVLLIRARAYIETQKDVLALHDLDEVRDLMPNSVMLASVPLAWQAQFGPM
ncbi:hypothetical protein MMC07_001089 [Pseudocyphellaria aurata]|nr:hypothetical protein [Pseudocyphellaria aurata]